MKRLYIIASIPVINAVADVTTNFFPSGTLNPGSVRIAALLAVVASLITFRPTMYRWASWIWIFLSYTLVLALFASDLSVSVVNYWTKLFLSTACFFVGVAYIKSLQHLKVVGAGLLLASTVILLQLGLSQIFKLGSSPYLDDSLYLGGGLVHVVNTLVLGALFAPLVLPEIRRQVVLVLASVVIALAVLSILVVLRRGAIIGLVVGASVYAFLTPYKRRLVRPGLVGFVLFAVSVPLLAQFVSSRWEVRSFQTRSVTEERRFWESEIVVREMLAAPAAELLFGKQLFNSQQYFRDNHGRARRLHVDVNILLHGAGVVGLFLYGMMHFAIVKHMPSRKRVAVKDAVLLTELRAVFWALLVSSVVIGMSHSLAVTGYRSALFLCIGGIVGVSRQLTVRSGQAYASRPASDRFANI